MAASFRADGSPNPFDTPPKPRGVTDLSDLTIDRDDISGEPLLLSHAYGRSDGLRPRAREDIDEMDSSSSTISTTRSMTMRFMGGVGQLPRAMRAGWRPPPPNLPLLAKAAGLKVTPDGKVEPASVDGRAMSSWRAKGTGAKGTGAKAERIRLPSGSETGGRTIAPRALPQPHTHVSTTTRPVNAPERDLSKTPADDATGLSPTPLMLITQPFPLSPNHSPGGRGTCTYAVQMEQSSPRPRFDSPERAASPYRPTSPGDSSRDLVRRTPGPGAGRVAMISKGFYGEGLPPYMDEATHLTPEEIAEDRPKRIPRPPPLDRPPPPGM